MKIRYTALALTILASSAFTVTRTTMTVRAAPMVTPMAPRARINAMLSRAAMQEHISTAVVVSEHGRIVLEQGYGPVGHALTADTAFTTPELAELFVTAAVIRLIQQGRLPEAKLYPGQRAGGADLREAVPAIEHVTGLTLGSYLQQTFFRPLRMDSTRESQSAGGPATIYSTIDDLNRWNQNALNCTAVVPPGLIWGGAASERIQRIRGEITIHSVDTRDGLNLSERILPGVDSVVTLLSLRSTTDSRLIAAVLSALG